MMRRIGSWWIAVVVIAAILLMQNGGGWGVEASSSPEPGESQLLQTLLNLDRKYAAVARPRFGKRTKLSHQYAAPSSIDYENQMANSDMMNDWLPDRR